MPRGSRCHARSLTRSPMIDVAPLMHASDRAPRRTPLLRQKLPLPIRRLIPSQRHPRISTLLTAVVHQSVLADIKIPSTRAATPVIRLPIGNRLLKVIEPRVAPPRQVANLVPYSALLRTHRLQLSASIMNNPDARIEPQPHHPLTHPHRIVLIVIPATYNRVYIHPI